MQILAETSSVLGDGRMRLQSGEMRSAVGMCLIRNDHSFFRGFSRLDLGHRMRVDFPAWQRISARCVGN
jgi:hypothetical protein